MSMSIDWSFSVENNAQPSASFILRAAHESISDAAEKPLLPLSRQRQALMTPTIRPATPDDARGIARVHVESWRTTYREFLADTFLAGLSVDQKESMWRRIIEEPESGGFVHSSLDEEGTVIGFSSGGRERSGEMPYDGELYALYLLKEHQGKGIGRMLVDASVASMKDAGMRSMLIWVLRENPARGFYRAMGGEPVDEKTITVGGVDVVDVAYGWADFERWWN